MNHTTRHTTIRFRRWARKGYAIFSTLGRCVTIGRLGLRVADASLKKQKAGIAVNPQRTDSTISYADEPDDEPPCDILFLSKLISQPLLADEICCPKYNHLGRYSIQIIIAGRIFHISLRLLYFIYL